MKTKKVSQIEIEWVELNETLTVTVFPSQRAGTETGVKLADNVIYENEM